MTEHYFSKKPKSNNNERLFYYNNIKFYTSSSVFSKSHLDKGTELLIKESKITENAKILDIGCGYGAIGIILSKLYPKANITMSDINERAINLAKKNSKINNVNPKIIQSNLFENINEKFDIILSNPPQHAGKKVCFEMIEKSKKHLNDKGTLQLVARHNKGGKELSKKMFSVFGNVKEIAKKSGYRVYLSQHQQSLS